MSFDTIGQYERDRAKDRAPRQVSEQSAAQSGGHNMKACFGGGDGGASAWQTSNQAIGGGKDMQLQPKKTQLQQARDERHGQENRGLEMPQQQQEQQGRGRANRQAYNILSGE